MQFAMQKQQRGPARRHVLAGRKHRMRCSPSLGKHRVLPQPSDSVRPPTRGRECRALDTPQPSVTSHDVGRRPTLRFLFWLLFTVTLVTSLGCPERKLGPEGGPSSDASVAAPPKTGPGLIVGE